MHVRHLEQRIVYNKRSIDVKHYQGTKNAKGMVGNLVQQLWVKEIHSIK